MTTFPGINLNLIIAKFRTDREKISIYFVLIQFYNSIFPLDVTMLKYYNHLG